MAIRHSRAKILLLSGVLFLSMFPTITSMEMYVQKCSNFSDIVQYGIPNLSEIIMFSEDDDKTIPFEERFRAAINNAPGMVDKTKSDAENFFMLVYADHRVLLQKGLAEFQFIDLIPREPFRAKGTLKNNIRHSRIPHFFYRFSFSFPPLDFVIRNLAGNGGGHLLTEAPLLACAARDPHPSFHQSDER